MGHAKKRALSIVMVLMFCAAAGKGYAAENVLRLSVDECIEQALTRNLNLESSRLGLRLNELSLIQERSAFDPSLNLSLDHGNSESPNYTKYIPVSTIESKSSRLNFTFGQNLSTGANWGFGLFNTLSESNVELEKNYTSYLGVSVDQPLLKGFGKRVTQSSIYITEIEGESTKLDIENNAVELLYQVLSAYWNLVSARESMYALELSLAQADSLLAYNQKGLQLGVLTESDVLEAKSARLSRVQEILTQKNTIREAGDILKKLLNITADNDWSVEIIPTEKLEVEPIEIDAARALEEALERRPDYRKMLMAIKQDEILLGVAKNSTLPSLDLSASYRLNSSGTSVSKNFDNMSDAEAYGWNIGLSLNYPLKNRNSKAALEKKKVDMKRNQLRLDDIKNTIVTDIRSSIGKVSMNREKVDVAALSVEVNELKLKKEEERFRNHLSTSYLVLEYQKDLAGARNLYHQALRDYTMAVLEYQRSKGTLLNDMNVTIISRGN